MVVYEIKEGGEGVDEGEREERDMEESKCDLINDGAVGWWAALRGGYAGFFTVVAEYR